MFMTVKEAALAQEIVELKRTISILRQQAGPCRPRFETFGPFIEEEDKVLQVKTLPRGLKQVVRLECSRGGPEPVTIVRAEARCSKGNTLHTAYYIDDSYEQSRAETLSLLGHLHEKFVRDLARYIADDED